MKKKAGFTFVELILYLAIVTVMLGALVPFAWNIIGSSSKNNTEREVFSQARIISERIKYEIRNSTGFTSFISPSPTITITTSVPATSPTIINFVGGNVTIQQGLGTPVVLNSPDVLISGFSFANNTSPDNKTKNISYQFTLSTLSTRQEFAETTTIRSSAEIRTN